VIVVCGATGTVGRLVVDGLVAAGQPVRAMTRAHERAGLPPGVEVVADDLGSVRPAQAPQPTNRLDSINTATRTFEVRDGHLVEVSERGALSIYAPTSS
jgi:nucleoside-diphosphate-sugar epimerase